jgi:hypothetical protein
MEERPARIVDWYRVDSGPRMRRVLVTGSSLLTLGALVTAVSFLARQALDVRVAATAVGFVLVAWGALFTVAGMHRILREDAYLAIRTDGLVLQSSSGETHLAWDALDSARWDSAGSALVLERRQGDAIVVARPFARIDGAALAGRIEQARRRAAMGMLR